MVWGLILLITRGQSVYIHRLHMILLLTRGQSVYTHRLHCNIVGAHLTVNKGTVYLHSQATYGVGGSSYC